MAELSAFVIGGSAIAEEHRKGYAREGVRLASTREEADIWSICSPDPTHADYIVEGLAAGKHIFCEKPLCQTRAEFERIRAAVRQAPSILLVNFPLPLHPPFLEAKRLIDEDAFGDIYRVVATYHWGRAHKLKEGWRAQPEYSLWHGAGSHMVDLLAELGFDLAPGYLLNATSYGELHRAEFYPAHPVEIVIDGVSDCGQHFHRIEIYGTKDNLFLDNREECDKAALIPGFVEEIRSGQRNEAQTQRDFLTWEVCEAMRCRASA